MSNTRSREIPVIEPDPELEITLRRMNQNSGIQGDEVNPQCHFKSKVITLYYFIFVVNVKYRDNLPLHAIKSTIEAMKISYTLMGYSSFPLYHTVTLLW